MRALNRGRGIGPAGAVFLAATITAPLGVIETRAQAQTPSTTTVIRRPSIPNVTAAETRVFGDLEVEFALAMQHGDTGKALVISREMYRLVQTQHALSLSPTDPDFAAQYSITTRDGFELIRKLHVAQHSEIEALLAQGRYRSALDLFSRDLALDKALFGDASPVYLATLGKYALMAKVAGEYRLAKTWLQEKTRVSEKMLGRDSLERAMALTALAELESDVGRLTDGQSHTTEALDILATLNVTSGHDYRMALAAASRVELHLGNARRAEDLTMAILEDLKKLGESASLEYGVNLKRAAQLLHKRGEITKAEQLFLAAVENARDAGGGQSVVYALRVKSLAEFYHATGRHTLADQFYKYAHPVLQQAGMKGFLGDVVNHRATDHTEALHEPTDQVQTVEADQEAVQFLERIEDLIAD